MAATYPLTISAPVEPTINTFEDDTGFNHNVLHTSHSDEINAAQTYIGTNATQTTPTAANAVLNSTSATASTWATIPTTVDYIITTPSNTTGHVVSVDGAQNLTGKTYNKVTITAPATGSTLTLANGKTLTVNNSLTLVGTDATTITFQGTDTYVGRSTTDTGANRLKNKDLEAGSTNIVDGTDTTKKLNVTTSGNTTAITGTLAAAFSTAKILTLPDATDTLVGKATTDNLTNKTLTSPVLATPTVAGGSRIYTLRSRTIIQNGTTSYTIPSGVTALLVQCLAGGGGGGGAASTSAQSAAGAGGGGGSYSESFLTSLPASPVTVAVGAGGAAGIAGANAGGTGGNTTFNTTTVTASGGGGGGGGVAANQTSNDGTPGAGGASGTGDVAMSGMSGERGLLMGSIDARSGFGGNGAGPYGGGGGQDISGTGPGLQGGTYGSGGSGGSSAGTNAAQAGGAGTKGVMVIWEFV